MTRLGPKQRAKFEKIRKTDPERAKEYRRTTLEKNAAKEAAAAAPVETPAPVEAAPPPTLPTPTIENISPSAPVATPEEIKATEAKISPEAPQINYGGSPNFNLIDIRDQVGKYLGMNEPYVQQRIDDTAKDINRNLASRGAFNSGAAMKTIADSASRIRGEETTRALDLARNDVLNQIQVMLANQATLANTNENNAARFNENLKFNINRGDGLREKEFSNTLEAIRTFMEFSPLNTGFNASTGISNNILEVGKNNASAIGNEFNRPTGYVNTGGGPGPYVGPAPMGPDLTEWYRQRAVAEGAAAINAENNKANKRGNWANILPGIISGIGNWLGGGKAEDPNAKYVPPTLVGASRR